VEFTHEQAEFAEAEAWETLIHLLRSVSLSDLQMATLACHVLYNSLVSSRGKTTIEPSLLQQLTDTLSVKDSFRINGLSAHALDHSLLVLRSQELVGVVEEVRDAENGGGIDSFTQAAGAIPWNV
jgi:hypothetical protein